MQELLIKAEKITKAYSLPAETIYAVRDVTVSVPAGDFIAVMGPSGSGKTTLLDLLGCLERISSGRLEVLGRDVSRLKENSLVTLRRRNIGFVFQDFLLIPTLNALENVMLPLLFAGMPRDTTRAKHLLERVGLSHRLTHLPKELSGGERQRVAIARALVTSPRLLFADEPTGNLDSKSGEEIATLLKQLNRDDHVTVILTTHNRTLAAFADSVVYLKDGRITPAAEAL